MVALESLMMRVTVFPILWCEMLNTTAGENFITMFCNSCNYFREYINLILTSERDFLQNDTVFELVKYCLSKINPPLLTSQFITDYLKIMSSECSINSNLLEEGPLIKKNIEILVVSFFFLISNTNSIRSSNLIQFIYPLPFNSTSDHN